MSYENGVKLHHFCYVQVLSKTPKNKKGFHRMIRKSQSFHTYSTYKLL